MSKIPRGGCAIWGERSGYTAAQSGRPAGAQGMPDLRAQNGRLLSYSGPVILGGLTSLARALGGGPQILGACGRGPEVSIRADLQTAQQMGDDATPC